MDMFFINGFSSKSSILYNIIDIDEVNNKLTLDKNNYNFDIIFLGRLTYPKNPHRLL